MMNTWKDQFKFPPNTEIVGKWHNNDYRLMKQLGEGANGVVYLATGTHGYSALKMSPDSFSITSEVNVLKAFAKAQGTSLGPSLYDVDDWETKGNKIHFYAMEYIQGPDLLSFIKRKGHSWSGVMIVQLLDVLERLHNQGWVFGDLKPENLIVTGSPPKIRCIDVGGTTLKGRAIKEFTEFFDRGYWGLGSRKAESSYDIFSTAMLLINLFYQDRFTKKNHPYKQLMGVIRSNKELVKYEIPLKRAIKGEYNNAKEMKDELLAILSMRPSNLARTNQIQRKKKQGNFLETAALLIFTAFLYAFYIFTYIL
ncbi:protein kinase domain-containing protein [Lederbergia lenta]|uniref:Serine/threonine-protein kinase n=1 Tax=Lederbergia lenta TaxID=1467 RepID=A0A2X4VFV1_LEDLE|nr:serine/threonine protein kinase [Lederbergia lenta]MEC2323844.1 protein kinase family protein [Lederbergia lenta]SQI51147.1 serine/threonine-protein kinase [Lederbergia lenta]